MSINPPLTKREALGALMSFGMRPVSDDAEIAEFEILRRYIESQPDAQPQGEAVAKKLYGALMSLDQVVASDPAFDRDYSQTKAEVEAALIDFRSTLLAWGCHHETTLTGVKCAHWCGRENCTVAFAAPPASAQDSSLRSPSSVPSQVPEEKYPDDGNGDEDSYNRGWNDCRATMLANQEKPHV